MSGSRAGSTGCGTVVRCYFSLLSFLFFVCLRCGVLRWCGEAYAACRTVVWERG